MTRIYPLQSALPGITQAPHNQVIASPPSIERRAQVSTDQTKPPSKNILAKLIEASKESRFARLALGFIGAAGFGINHFLEYFGIDVGFSSKIEKLQNSFLFKPNHIDYFPPPDRNKVSFEEVSISVKDGSKLHGYYFPKEDADLTMIFLHGYNGNADECFPESLKIREHINANVLIVDYRGFGKSEGSPTRAGVIEDAEAMYNFLTEVKGIEGKRIILSGSSLGGSIALSLTEKLRKSGKDLGIVSILYPFSSVRDVAKWRFPHIPNFFIFDDLLNSKESVKNLTVPLFIGHGDNDKDTPLEQSVKIYSSAKLLDSSEKELFVIPGLGHEHLCETGDHITREYFTALRNFVDRHLRTQKR